LPVTHAVPLLQVNVLLLSGFTMPARTMPTLEAAIAMPTASAPAAAARFGLRLERNMMSSFVLAFRTQ